MPFLGLDGVEIGLLIVFICLFAGIMTGFPVAFALGGAAVVSFAIIGALDAAGLLVHETIDTQSPEYAALLAEGVSRGSISVFRYPDLPRIAQHLFEGGWDTALTRNISFIVNRMNERVIAGQSIDTLLAVLMFVMMGITLERSRIAEDLLTTMARVFGRLPGGLAVSIVVVGAFLAASTGIVGATVVTMGLLALPTMLRNGYSPELSTGVISASGTLGQIIPPSIVIVLLGTLAGDLYSTAQENRAQLMGCSDALTFLGEPAVVSVGTLFQAALIPGLLLAGLYAAYAFGFALLNPAKAPPMAGAGGTGEAARRLTTIAWLVAVPATIVLVAVLGVAGGLVGSQSVTVNTTVQDAEAPDLRTNVSPQCAEAMIELHGQDKWDRSLAQAEALAASSTSTEVRELSGEEIAVERARMLQDAPLVGSGIATMMVLFALILSLAKGVAPRDDPWPLLVGALGVVLGMAADAALITPLTSPAATFALMAIPVALVLYGLRAAASRLSQNDLVRVVFPPLVLIVAVLGSILGGITNPTPAAALGAAGAIMLAAYRRLRDENRSGRIVVWASFAVVIMILVGVNFDLRLERQGLTFADWAAVIVAEAAYHMAFFGVLYSVWVLYRSGVMRPVVRETAKVTSMVFTILIGSQLLNLVVISFGGEQYIQDFLRAFDSEFAVFLIVMLVLFILGFVLDFLEIIYIVIPIVGPVIYGGTLDPKWVTIMIAINLQTSFLTPPFGFALFYLRGVAPPSVTTGHIYRGVIPFVIIQLVGLVLLWLFPQITTFLPNLLPH
jgi:TRAP-type mannitol/chloroaromatic compound transport system permease large subunit